MGASASYTWADIIAIVVGSTTRLSDDRRAAAACNLAQNLIWGQYDWRESIADLPPFYLVPNLQDIGPPFSAVPSDFKGLREVFFVDLGGRPPRYLALRTPKNLEKTQTRTIPTSMCYLPDKRAFRLYPRVPSNLGAPEHMITGTYKKSPVRITSKTLSTALSMEDQHVRMFIEALKWSMLSLASDPTAGGVQRQTGFEVYTGQYAVAVTAIDDVAEEFGLNDGDPSIAPAEALDPTAHFEHPALGWIY